MPLWQLDLFIVGFAKALCTAASASITSRMMPLRICVWNSPMCKFLISFCFLRLERLKMVFFLQIRSAASMPAKLLSLVGPIVRRSATIGRVQRRCLLDNLHRCRCFGADPGNFNTTTTASSRRFDFIFDPDHGPTSILPFEYRKREEIVCEGVSVGIFWVASRSKCRHFRLILLLHRVRVFFRFIESYTVRCATT